MKSLNYAVVSNLCALVIGVLLVIGPGVAVSYLVMSIGVLFLLPGLFGVFSYFLYAKKREEAGVRATFPIVALGSALLGIWLLVDPAFFISTLMYVLGALLVLGGVSQLANLLSVRSVVHIPAFLYVIPALVLAAGLVVLFNPFTAAEVPFILLGCSAIVYAVTDLFRMLRYRRKQTKVEDVTVIEEYKE